MVATKPKKLVGLGRNASSLLFSGSFVSYRHSQGRSVMHNCSLYPHIHVGSNIQPPFNRSEHEKAQNETTNGN